MVRSVLLTPGRVRGTGSRRVLAASVLATTLLAAACTSDGPVPEGPATPSSATLTALALGPVPTWDPQRLTSRQDTAFAGRVFLRTLTAFAPSTGDEPARLVADLATDTGTPVDDFRVWSFTLRDGVRWQDGTDVTCGDVAYGVSRGFAAVLQGPADAAAVLDIPRSASGTSSYRGPYDGAGQTAFDKAVSCKDRTITFRLATPTPDFDQLVSLPSFAPYAVTQDRRADSQYVVFSNGPYLLRDGWEPSSGGTWVRNPQWSAESDPFRRGRVGRIRYQEGVETQSAIQRIMADHGEDRAAVSLAPAPPALQQQINSSQTLSARAVAADDSIVDYLAPVWTSPLMSEPLARQALAAATNRAAYVTALGGSRSARATSTVLTPTIPGHTEESPPFGPEGDPVRARAMLVQADLTLPVPLRVAYRSGETADKAMAALAAGWDSAGFAVTLQPIEDDYFDLVGTASRASSSDVLWGNWAATLPTASSVLPVLFDSRLNLTSTTSGRDLGRYTSARTNAEITRIATIADRAARDSAWAALDQALVGEGAYIALAQRSSVFIAGSDVRPLLVSAALGGVVDLAEAGLR